MFAGVPSRNPSAASTSLTVAASAGTTATSIPSSSGSRAPDTAASSIACSAGEVVWWTTSNRGTARPPDPLALGRPAQGRAELGCHVGEYLRVVLRRERERQRERHLGHLAEARVLIQGRRDLLRRAEDVPREQHPGRPDRRLGGRRPRRDVRLVLGPL